MILGKIIINIVKIVLTVIMGIAIILMLPPFFACYIGYASNGMAFNTFFELFINALKEYLFGTGVPVVRAIGSWLLIIGFLGGVILHIILLITKKGKIILMILGLCAFVGAFLVYPTLSGESMSAFFAGNVALTNYIPVGVLTYSIALCLIGANHFLSGLKAFTR